MSLLNRNQKPDPETTCPPFITAAVWEQLTQEDQHQVGRLTEQAQDVDLADIQPVLNWETWNQKVKDRTGRTTGVVIQGQDPNLLMMQDRDQAMLNGGFPLTTEKNARDDTLNEYLAWWDRSIKQARQTRQVREQADQRRLQTQRDAAAVLPSGLTRAEAVHQFHYSCPVCSGEKAREKQLCGTCSAVSPPGTFAY
jgi:hypothetical protein